MEGNHNGVDRRTKGIQRVIATDGNGAKDDSIQFNIQTAKVWINFAKALAALLVIVGGAVWGGVRYGISSEVHDEIERECEPRGMIDTHVRTVATELVDEFQEIVEDNIADTDIKLQEQHDLGIRLEERQIALQDKMDADKAELIREIRRAGDSQ
jgi:hypothetical protein